VISADTSTWIAFLQGERGDDTGLLDRALADKLVVMAPVVLTELLSDPKLDAGIGRRARLGDALIAQACVDHQVPLLTRDRDFRAFAEAADLRIVAEP